MIPVFVGYDPREHEAYEVCVSSLQERSSAPLHIVKLHLGSMQCAGFYDRPWDLEGGQRIDGSDGKPFSTDFSFTRFLIPALSLYQGWAIFCDCDFLFLEDVAKLWALRDESKAVMVVKHHHEPTETVKMDGCAQSAYARKNWSSLILWNCAHQANKNLRMFEVNRRSGSWLHGFRWLKDDQIGSLPIEWNWLSGVNDPIDQPSAVHFTLGGPWFADHRHHPYCDLWLEQARRLKSQPIAA